MDIIHPRVNLLLSGGEVMLKKEEMIPGTILEILPKIKDGLPGVLGAGPHKMEYLPVMKSTMLGDGGIKGFPGDQLEIIKGPHKKNNINQVEVRIVTTGYEGIVYWCSLRASCKKI